MKDMVTLWNAYRNNNNCYAFAFDHLDPYASSKLQPGELAGLEPLKESEYSCPAFLNRVALDNPAVKRNDTLKRCPAGTHGAALFLDNIGVKKDYHFYREMRPGMWAHKPGSTMVQFVDDSGNPISDPRKADRDYVNDQDESTAYDYAEYCGGFCVPNGDAPSEVWSWSWIVMGVLLVCFMAWVVART